VIAFIPKREENGNLDFPDRTRSMKTFSILALLTTLAFPAQADSITLTATGQGWCSGFYRYCNNTNPAVIANSYTDLSFINWFAFQIPPNLTVLDASFTLENTLVSSPLATFRLYELPDDFAAFLLRGDLTTPVLGSATITTGPVTANLNQTALDQITTHEGSLFLLAGYLPTYPGAFGDIIPATLIIAHAPGPTMGTGMLSFLLLTIPLIRWIKS